MKCELIQKSILAAAMRGRGDAKRKYSLGPMDDKIGVVTDYSIFLIPKDEFVLSLSRLSKMGFVTDRNMRAMLASNKEYSEASLTPELRIIDKVTWQKIQAIDEPSLFSWVETKLLKPFESPTFEICKDRFSPIYVREDGEIAGLVMPYLVEG